MKTLLTHMGLGDAIVSAGAAVVLAKSHGGLRFPCIRHNYKSVKSIFINHPEIEVWPIDTDEELVHLPEEETLRCGVYDSPDPNNHRMGQPLLGECFDQWFYRGLNVPLNERWDSCPIKEAIKQVKQLEVPNWKYAFVHDDQQRGFIITEQINFLQIRPIDTTGSILEYADLIEQATEVHVINSSFWHLTESLEPTGKLFLHWYARTDNSWMKVKMRRNWTLL